MVLPQPPKTFDAGREGEGSQATGSLDHERENKQTDGQK